MKLPCVPGQQPMLPAKEMSWFRPALLEIARNLEEAVQRFHLREVGEVAAA